MDVVLACMCPICMAVPKEARRGPPILWKWNYRQLRAAMWVLGIEPRSFERAADALNL